MKLIALNIVVSNYTLVISSKEIPGEIKYLINNSLYLKLKGYIYAYTVKKVDGPIVWGAFLLVSKGNFL